MEAAAAAAVVNWQNGGQYFQREELESPALSNSGNVAIFFNVIWILKMVCVHYSSIMSHLLPMFSDACFSSGTIAEKPYMVNKLKTLRSYLALCLKNLLLSFRELRMFFSILMLGRVRVRVRVQ